MTRRAEPMKITRTRHPRFQLETGQVWQCEEGQVLIGLVGKTLVHYKFYRPDDRRPPIQLARQDVLQKFLQQKRAVLQPGPLIPPVKSGGKQIQFGRRLLAVSRSSQAIA